MTIQFYAHTFENNYELLITYYPRYYRDVREMVAILKAHGSTVDMLQNGVERVFSNEFIDSMDEDMVARYEAFLGLRAGSQTLEERKRVLLSYFSGFGKVSSTSIIEMIQAIADVDVECVFKPYDEWMNNALYITMTQDCEATVNTAEIISLLKKRLPAHIWWVLIDTIPVTVETGAVERAYFTNLTMHYYSMYWDYRRLNGTWLLDGTFLLDGLHFPLHIENINKYRSKITESAQVKLEIPHDLWYLDGEYLLDGEKLLDADVLEEVI